MIDGQSLVKRQGGDQLAMIQVLAQTILDGLKHSHHQICYPRFLEFCDHSCDLPLKLAVSLATFVNFRHKYRSGHPASI